jgi:hypothetical protein
MDVEKNGGRLFRRPKLALSCSAEGKEGRKEGRKKGRNAKSTGDQIPMSCFFLVSTIFA